MTCNKVIYKGVPYWCYDSKHKNGQTTLLICDDGGNKCGKVPLDKVGQHLDEKKDIEVKI